VESLVVTWRELLVVVIAVLVVYAAELLLLLHWSGKQGLRPRGLFRPWRRAGQANTDNQAINNLGQELGELRRQVAHLQADLEKLRSPAPPAVSPYNQAIQMAREGLSASEVASGCGISRGEAELIVALYRKLRI
jgi:Protein of unknown function (DUF2802)